MRKNLILCSMLIVANFVFAQKSQQWIHFDWHGETIFGKYYPKVAISVPLKLEKLPYNFCGQLDLGATTTLLYENSFKAYSSLHPEVLQKLDTTLGVYYLYGKKCSYLKNLNIQLDKTLFPNRNIVFVPNFGDEIPADSINTPTQKLVGTIAPDLFQGKLLVIDFRKNQLTTFDQLPAAYSKANFVNALIRKGRIKIPLKFGDSTYYALFDTGNCLSDLLLDKESIQKFTAASETPKEFLNGNTWGQSIIYFSKTLTQSFFFNKKKLVVNTTLYSDLDSDVRFNKEEKIIGLIGPVMFSNNIVIIDYKNSRFGIL